MIVHFSLDTRPAICWLLAACAAVACGEIKIVEETDGAADGVADAAGLTAPDVGADLPTAPKVAADEAPKVKIQTPEKGGIIGKAKVIHFRATASDDRDPPSKLAVKWTTTALKTPLQEGTIEAAGVSEFDFGDLPAGGQKIRVEVTDLTGNIGFDEVGILINTAPGAPSIEVTPAKPKTGDTLEAKITAEATDIDRTAAELIYMYAWFRNGEATEFKAKQVPAGSHKKGETWSVKVKAVDPGKAESVEGSAQVVIGNSVPVAPAVDITPTSIDLLGEATCTVTQPATDPDGDGIGYTYVWYLNGYENKTEKTSKIKIQSLVSDKENTPPKTGDKVQCGVVAAETLVGGIAAEEVLSAHIVLKPFDVCNSPLTPCDLAAACSNTDTLDVICTCPKGYTGDGKVCFDIDECAGGLCSLAADCTNTQGGYECGCKAGYNGDGLDCSDVDECGDSNGGCALAAECMNTSGSYTCTCKGGYAGDGKTCGDVDECKTGTHKCPATADCVNTVGGNDCACKVGYEVSGSQCADIDECKTDNGGCDKNGVCTNIAGSMQCACGPGWTGTGKVCADVDECKIGNGGCGAEATCANTPGGRECACKAGYTGDGVNCTDVNECLKDNGGCDANAVCANKVGTSACACKPGFAGDGKKCADIDECKEGVYPCAVASKATCANTTGSYKCTCTPPNVGDGKSCSLKDLCLNNPVGCSPDATCKMVDDNPICTCKSGYQGDGKLCSDLDECKLGTATCAKEATCTNKPGGADCKCPAGYEGDGKMCINTNECATNNGGCAKQATCTDLPGSFQCTCKVGYSGDGKTCTDVNECASANGGCHVFATCSNIPGGATCACKPGFTGDGKTCADIDECKATLPACNPYATCTNTSGSFQCACKAGFAGDGKTCTDVDECKVNNGGCNANANCLNTPGSSKCECKAGFTGDGKTCADIDECPPLNWKWNFASLGYGGWAMDGPSVVNTNVKWHGINGVLYYGDPVKGNFDTPGAANKGSVTGPPITLSAHPAHRLTFDLDHQAECSGSFDKLFVQLVVAGTVVNVWDKSKFSQCSAGFKKQTVDLVGYGGKTVQIRFSFDTGDSQVNGTKGVHINNLILSAAGGPCDVNAACQNTAGSFTCTCQGAYVGDGKKCYVFGSVKEWPAPTCAAILAKFGSPTLPYGTYWLNFSGQPLQYTCDNDAFMQVAVHNFEGGVNGGWSPATITTCGGFGAVLGGSGVAGGGYVVINTFKGLPPHSSVRVSGTYLRIDTWENEVSWVRLDGAQVWSVPFTAVAGASQCGDAGFQDSGVSFSVTPPHVAPQVTVQIGSTLNEAPTNEAFGLDNFQIWVK
ncbi:MAG: hypothetical protein EXR79_00145 [Myxococcales bacterium]|nr:hypothetical protein [Myxococcales bacterium]